VEDKRRHSHQDAAAKKQDWFLGKLKYRNTLPDLPFDPKLLQYPFDPLRFVRYSPHTTLETKFKFEMRPEPNLGIHIDLIDMAKYKQKPGERALFFLSFLFLAGWGKKKKKICTRSHLLHLIFGCLEDAALLEGDEVLMERYTTQKSSTESKAQWSRPIEPWLRRTEYTSGTIHRAQARDAVDGCVLLFSTFPLFALS